MYLDFDTIIRFYENILISMVSELNDLAYIVNLRGHTVLLCSRSLGFQILLFQSIEKNFCYPGSCKIFKDSAQDPIDKI